MVNEASCDPIKIVSAGIFICILVSMTIGFFFFKHEILDYFKSLKFWFEKHAILSFTFILICAILSVVFLIPGGLFILGGCYIYGSLYGKLKGFFICWTLFSISVSIGGLCAFLISRTFFSKCLKPQIQKYRIINALDWSLGLHGFKLMALLRFAPIIPYNVLNYGMSVTSVSAFDFFFGGFCGIIPH